MLECDASEAGVAFQNLDTSEDWKGDLEYLPDWEALAQEGAEAAWLRQGDSWPASFGFA